MTDYSEYQVKTAPSWLSRFNGVIWNTVLGYLKDALLASAKGAIYNRFASRCHLDALEYLAHDKDIAIGYEEDEPQLRARIKGAWSSHENAGRRIGFLNALSLAGFDNVQIREKKDDDTLEWFEFEVWLIYPFKWPDPFDDDGFWTLSGGVWDDGGVWPEDVPAKYLNLVRSIISKWKPTHTRCRKIVFVHGGDFWTDTDATTWELTSTDVWDEQVTEHSL